MYAGVGVGDRDMNSGVGQTDRQTDRRRYNQTKRHRRRHRNPMTKSLSSSTIRSVHAMQQAASSAPRHTAYWPHHPSSSQPANLATTVLSFTRRTPAFGTVVRKVQARPAPDCSGRFCAVNCTRCVWRPGCAPADPLRELQRSPTPRCRYTADGTDGHGRIGRVGRGEKGKT